MKTLCKVLVALLAASLQPANAEDAPAEPIADETVFVTAEPDKWALLWQEGERAIEIACESMMGRYRYCRGEYEQALPHLQRSAMAGFPYAQARLSFIYQQGLAGKRDPVLAMTWLGTAAALDPTHPEIRQRFDDLWQRIPAAYKPQLEAAIAQNVAEHGAKAQGVSCRLVNDDTQLICRPAIQRKIEWRMRGGGRFRDSESHVFDDADKNERRGHHGRSLTQCWADYDDTMNQDAEADAAAGVVKGDCGRAVRLAAEKLLRAVQDQEGIGEFFDGEYSGDAPTELGN